MPCYDPSPTDRDNRAVEVANLILYVFKELDLKVHPDIQVIAKSGHYETIGKEKHLDVLTKILCSTIDNLKKADFIKFEAIVYNSKSKQSRDLANWWEAHESFDKNKL